MRIENDRFPTNIYIFFVQKTKINKTFKVENVFLFKALYGVFKGTVYLEHHSCLYAMHKRIWFLKGTETHHALTVFISENILYTFCPKMLSVYATSLNREDPS